MTSNEFAEAECPQTAAILEKTGCPSPTYPVVAFPRKMFILAQFPSRHTTAALSGGSNFNYHKDFRDSLFLPRRSCPIMLDLGVGKVGDLASSASLPRFLHDGFSSCVLDFDSEQQKKRPVFVTLEPVPGGTPCLGKSLDLVVDPYSLCVSLPSQGHWSS
jgi:hypothetical protein